MIYANVPLVNLEDILDMRIRLTEAESLLRFHYYLIDSLIKRANGEPGSLPWTDVSRETKEEDDGDPQTLF